LPLETGLQVGQSLFSYLHIRINAHFRQADVRGVLFGVAAVFVIRPRIACTFASTTSVSSQAAKQRL
jgi:hypothetical protein